MKFLVQNAAAQSFRARITFSFGKEEKMVYVQNDDTFVVYVPKSSRLNSEMNY